jgi:hypothetical protein
MNYKTEFPQFDDSISLPEGWEDESWHNNACPSFSKPLKNNQRLVLWYDYKSPELRDSPSLKRFGLYVEENDECIENLCMSDNLEEVLSVADITQEACA